MQNELRILLSTTSEKKSLYELIEDLNFSPDRGYSKGDMLPNINRQAKVSLWCLIQECPSLNLENGMNDLMNRIINAGDLFQRLKKLEIHLEIVCYMADRSLDLGFSNHQLKFVSELGCSLGIDYFIVPTDS